MARPRKDKQKRQPGRCRECGLVRLPDETFPGGFCPNCRDAYATRRRRETGAKVLAHAKPAAVEERNGDQCSSWSVLPPKRRRRRKG